MNRKSEINFREVPFEIMLKCDGDIKCMHWLLSNSFSKYGVDLNEPMPFNEFLQLIGEHLTSVNCKSLFEQARWYVIDDGIQPDYYLKDLNNNQLTNDKNNDILDTNEMPFTLSINEDEIPF